MIARILTLLLVAAPVAAQGTFTTYGSGCTFNNQTAAIGNVGTPRVGQTFDITYRGPNFTSSSAQQTAQPFLALGLGQQNLPLPAGLLLQQPAGCTVLVTVNAILPTQPEPNRPAYQSSLPFTVPNNPAFLGAVFFAQWAALVQQCGFAGCDLAAAITSDAAICVVGQ